ncbi:hypothetical protein ACTHSU_10990, partial [Neisseria sp. P0009.S005]|uniref:hypothetical protein n=1 Tax=Neisseria sp. P0009.S005 TaxID=3436712 RepID=UPI003F7F37DB
MPAYANMESRCFRRFAVPYRNKENRRFFTAPAGYLWLHRRGFEKRGFAVWGEGGANPGKKGHHRKHNDAWL